MNKEQFFTHTREKIQKIGLTISAEDNTRPWGGFFVIDESQAEKFINTFFTGRNIDNKNRISPKILLVAPHQKLSWQYHFRRSELWKVVDSRVGVIKSDTDNETPLIEYGSGETISILQGERHRLIGLSDWGIVAEIWIHTDPYKPSNEEDIVRLQDDFGR